MNKYLFYCHCLFIGLSGSLHAQTIQEGLSGDWSLDVEDGTPGWMSIQTSDGKPMVHFRLYIGNSGPFPAEILDDGRLTFQPQKGKKKNKPSPTRTITVGLEDGALAGSVRFENLDGPSKSMTFTGARIPPMPTEAPDLTKIQFGEPISLFNGKDLTGWTPYEDDKINGWSAKDGLLVNSTTKTDFSPTGDHANLMTKAVFDDFKLHIEFLIGSQRNSGIYLRGMYEAQVVDRDSRMQGIHGVGAIFNLIEPTENAGKVGGEWQTYEITLVDRHVTVVLNGVTVIDNVPVPGPTAGAIHTNPAAPGPIYLQGDHTSVSYRNIHLSPVIKE